MLLRIKRHEISNVEARYGATSKKYVKQILKRFKMDDSTPASSPIEPNLKFDKHGEEDKVEATFFK